MGVLSNRYTGALAEKVGIVQRACKQTDLIDTAIEHANTFLSQGPLDRNMITANKEALNSDLLQTFNKSDNLISKL